MRPIVCVINLRRVISTLLAMAAVSRNAAAVMLLALAACGGGGGDSGGNEGMSPPLSPSLPGRAPTANEVALESEAGDSLGQGRSYHYTSANSVIELKLQAGLIQVLVTGEEDWQGDFQLPDSGALGVAAYVDVPRYPAASTGQASMRWFGQGRGCVTATGSFWIDQVDYSNGVLRSMVIRFERRCDGASAAIRGQIRWLAADPTTPPPVVDPPPDGLWRPAAGTVPASGNYLYLASEAGDIVGQGRTALFTRGNARLIGSGGTGFFELDVQGEQGWWGILWGRETARDGQLKKGHYPDMARFPFANPTRGGQSWIGQGRGCADVRGWAAIDHIEYDQHNFIVAIEYRFEQRCVGSMGALHGAVRWTQADADDPVTPSSDTAPGSWRPAAGSTPTSGTYVYLQGEAGDPMTAGVTHVFTPLNAKVELVEDAGALRLSVTGQDRWFGYFRAVSGAAPLRPGVYTNLTRGLFPGGDQPHFSWTGQKACENLPSWVAIDDVAYAGGQLIAIDLRFEQRCLGLFNVPATGALRGEVHWRADDLRRPAGPKPDAPVGAWQPAAGAVPSASDVSYLHVNSMRSDGVGLGLSATYTQADAGFRVVATGNRLSIRVAGDQTWTLDFEGIAGLDRLEHGYHEDLQRYPFHNPTRGGLHVAQDSRGCNSVKGGFTIDSVSYTPQGDLSGLLMRFEQHCERTMSGALWGEFRWASGDATAPPGPITPPAGLWQPASSQIPASGNYVYFQSLGEDFIGGGNRTLTLTPAEGQFTMLQDQHGVNAMLMVDTGGSTPWLAQFKVMSSLTRLQPGYYGGITGTLFKNPAKGGLSFSGEGRGCNSIDGWFVIDDVTYVGDTLTSLQARFEQVCEESGLLRAKISWQKP